MGIADDGTEALPGISRERAEGRSGVSEKDEVQGTQASLMEERMLNCLMCLYPTLAVTECLPICPPSLSYATFALLIALRKYASVTLSIAWVGLASPQ